MHDVPPGPDLTRLSVRLPANPRTRFAPSPTGFLHLGHIVNAVYVWGLAQALGGSVVLRLEDHDRERARPDFERAILDDLEWLQLQPADPGAGLSPTRQSEREHTYMEAFERLRASGRLYGCSCSRRQIERQGGRGGGELRYPGTCRGAAVPLARGAGVRVQLDDSPETFDDALVGAQVQVPADQSGDLLIRDRTGQWTYQFAVTVDDAVQEIDLVIRGLDLLASTGRQIQLARLLGRATPPIFLHHPLVMGPTGVKLSKSNRDAGIRELRAAGYRPGDVLGLAAAAVGLTGTVRSLDPRRLGELFET